MATLPIAQILRASFVSLALLACENGGGDDSTDTGNTSDVTTGPGTDATTGSTTVEPTTTTTPTTGTDDTGPDDTGTADTGPDDTGTDDTGPDDTGTDDTGPDDTGTEDTGDTGTGDTGTGDTGTGDTGMAGLSFAVDVYGPIIAPSCGCHADGSGGLKIGNDAATAFAAMVGVPSNDVPAMPRVDPGASQNSYLFHKVADTHESVGGEGNRMPLGGQLDPASIATIEQWIDEGALP